MGATGAGGEGFTLAVLGPVRRLHDPVDCLGVQPVEYVGAFLELQTKVTKYKKNYNHNHREVPFEDRRDGWVGQHRFLEPVPL